MADRTPQQWRIALLDEAQRLEFDLAGVASVDEFPDLRHFADWITQGRSGEMQYLARRREHASSTNATLAPTDDASSTPYLREDIRHVFPWARSVICCGLLYNSPYPHSTECHSATRGWISRYAWGDDYHAVLLDRMRHLALFLQEASGETAARVYVDTGPLVERAYAARAGLGWIGKNTCLIHEDVGSFFFLGALITDLHIAGDSPLPDRCGSCTRCLEACPTGALDRPYQMDASRCIAYLNIELRSSVPEELRPQLGHQLVGCDICQDVCPWNWEAPVTTAPFFQPRSGFFHPELEDLAAMGKEQFRDRFRGSAVKRVKYRGFLRNVALAMGNSGLPSFRPTLERLATAPDEVVVEAARWALDQLTG